MVLKSSRQQGDGPRKKRFLQWRGIGVRDAELVRNLALCRNRPAIPFAAGRTWHLILQWPISLEEAVESDTALM
jgi:hypothetical protein